MLTASPDAGWEQSAPERGWLHSGRVAAMSRSLVLGAGPIGAAVTALHVARGDEVVVATRSGTELPGARSERVDATDAAAISTAAKGTATIYLCTNPPYSQWLRAWPPVFAALIDAARASGASVVSMGNLYPYGSAATPMTEHSPEITTETKGLVRKAGWAALLDAHRRGEIRAVEVRASDYFGPGATATAHLGARFFEPILAGRTAQVVGDPRAAHSWAYLPDIAATLVAAAEYGGGWGRIWHVPSCTDDDRVTLGRRINQEWSTQGRVRGLPQWLLRTVGLVDPTIREVYRSSYQFTAPFVSDATETEQLLGVKPTSSDEALRATAASYRRPLSD